MNNAKTILLMKRTGNKWVLLLAFLIVLCAFPQKKKPKSKSAK